MDHTEYRDDMKKLRKNIKSTLDTGYSMKDVAHLGGAVSLARHMKDMMKGDACMVKDELKEVAKYLYMFETSKNPLYLHIAKEEFHHAEELLSTLEDSKDKAEMTAWIRKVKAELKKHKDPNPMEDLDDLDDDSNPKKFSFGG